MKKPKSSFEQLEKSAKGHDDVQICQEIIDAEYTTPLKSNSSSQGVPSFPLNSKYKTKQPTPESSNSDDETESFNLSPSLTNGSTLHDGTSARSEPPSLVSNETTKEPITKSNFENVYIELCELQHLSMKELSLEWFYFIFQGVDVNKIKNVLNDLNLKLDSETNGLCPNKNDIWAWAREVGSPDNVKLVIMGQDPYTFYTWDNKTFPRTFVPLSDGLGFSINPRYFEIEKKLPVHNSLKHILKLTSPAIEDSESFDGNLRPWVKQGVLLFDVHLTSAAHWGYMKREGGFHSDFGWEFVTDLVLKKLGAADRQPTVFLLWGKTARSKSDLVTGVHKVIDACHPMWYDMLMSDLPDNTPTPTNCYCSKYCWMLHHGTEAESRNDFKSANEFLEHQGRKGIVWDCFGKKEMLRRKSTNFRESLETRNVDYQREKKNPNNEKPKGCKRELDQANEDDEHFKKASKKAKSYE